MTMPTVIPAIMSCTSHYKKDRMSIFSSSSLKIAYSQVVSMNPLKNGEYTSKVAFKETR
jgi:hypothetical protein